MRISTRRSTPVLDQTDREHLRQTAATRGYQIIIDRMEDMLEKERNQLESLAGDDLVKQQGRVAMLRQLIDLPQTILTEIQNRTRPQREFR